MSRPGDANPLSHDERTAIIDGYVAGVKLREIAEQVRRPLGTVKTAVFNLRKAGLVGYRYNTIWPEGF